MEFEADMQSFLKQLGIADLFDISKANLTDIADDRLYVSDITHKSVIEGKDTTIAKLTLHCFSRPAAFQI